MSSQNYSNHVRYYTQHHFIFYPVLLIAIAASVIAYNHHPDQKEIWLAIIALFITIGWLSFMLRQHYALGNQDRIVRMELRFRYFLVTGKRLEPLENQLQFAQLAALRFASDDELETLIQKAIKENLSPRQIKKSIHHWIADDMRV